MVRICEQTIATWRHGTVSDMTKYPPRPEVRSPFVLCLNRPAKSCPQANGQFSYPVEYPSKGRIERGWFNPAQHEIQYDNYLSDIGERRWGWQ